MTKRLLKGWNVGPRAMGIVAAASLAIGAIPAGSKDAMAAIHPGGATVHTKEVQVTSQNLGKGTIVCPSGKRAISGGAAFHRPGAEPIAVLAAKLVSSSPTMSGRGWHAAGVSFEDDPLLLRITVACLPDTSVGAYIVRIKDLTAADNLFFEGSLGCGSGKRMVTGGAFWNPKPMGPTPTAADNLLRSSPSPDGKRWQVRGFAYNPDDVLRLVLLCRPADTVGPVTIRHRDILSPTDSSRGGSVFCPTGQRALAGGADWYENGLPAQTGSLKGSTVGLALRGWYAAGDLLSDTIALRVTVLCVPK